MEVPVGELMGGDGVINHAASKRTALWQRRRRGRQAAAAGSQEHHRCAIRRNRKIAGKPLKRLAPPTSSTAARLRHRHQAARPAVRGDQGLSV